VTVVISEGVQPVVIPPLIGDTVDQATAALTALNLVPFANGPLAGHVFDSNPEAGTSVLPGSSVTIYIR
jgi:beta-lactam-binding protein with PASTA domain